MQTTDVKLGDSYLAKIPANGREIQDLIVPLDYLGNRRWKVEQAHTGQILYIGIDKILCRTSPENEAEEAAEVLLTV